MNRWPIHLGATIYALLLIGCSPESSSSPPPDVDNDLTKQIVQSLNSHPFVKEIKGRDIVDHQGRLWKYEGSFEPLSEEAAEKAEQLREKLAAEGIRRKTNPNMK